MTALQKVNLGTPPTGTDGDASRTAFTKINSNVDVFNSQAALTSATGITAAQALTVAHVGKRVNISLASAGVINLPAASTCAADNVLLLRNIGTTVITLAITAGSGDTVALSKLNPGETALMDTDGVHAWTVLMRGRTNSDNEVVNGNCAVGGTLGVAGLATFTGGASLGNAGQATISTAGAYSGTSGAYTGNVTVGGTLSVTGQATFTVRPVFNGNTPWDSANFSASGNASQTFSVAAATSAAHAVRRDQTFGVGQSFINQTVNRAAGVSYTNSTSKPIYVTVSATSPAGNGTIVMNVAGIQVDVRVTAVAGGVMTVQAMVPPGAAYVLTTSGSTAMGSWWEYS